MDTSTHTHAHTRIDITAGTMPREQQAGVQDDDAGKCAAPQLDMQELRSRKRILTQAILTEYTIGIPLVYQWYTNGIPMQTFLFYNGIPIVYQCKHLCSTYYLYVTNITSI